MEANLKSKSLYKVELYLLKVMPMVIALVYLVNTVSSYLGIDLPILASIAGMSLIPLIFMYVSSYVFRFCGGRMGLVSHPFFHNNQSNFIV